MSAFVPVNPNFILIWTIISGIGDRTRVSVMKDALDLSANHPHPLAFSLVAKPGLFLFNLFFSSTNFTEKTVVLCAIRTQIVEIEGKHADHLTPTTAHPLAFSYVWFVQNNRWIQVTAKQLTSL